MGHAIEQVAIKRGHNIVLCVSSQNKSDMDEAHLRLADVAIEFTNPEAALSNVLTCLSAGLNVVSGSTGWNEHFAVARSSAFQNNVGFLQASNFSVGVNIFFEVNKLLAKWVPHLVGKRDSINVAMDWTEFDADNQATIMLSLLTSHGRATPLVWLSVDKTTLKNRRNGYEDQVLRRLAEVVPAGVRVTIVADRGFGDQKLYELLTGELKFDFVIRFRGNIRVTTTDGEVRTAAEWVGAGGRARTLRDAMVTADEYPVATVVCVQARDMKEPWCLAASATDVPARALINLYARRWGIECALRDAKDIRFGMGMGSMHLKTPDRRDRLWLICAFAVELLTLLGSAGEELGYDRYLKSNTTKRRTHSLLRQGTMLYQLIPNMTEYMLRPLIERFAQIVAGVPAFTEVFETV